MINQIYKNYSKVALSTVLSIALIAPVFAQTEDQKVTLDPISAPIQADTTQYPYEITIMGDNVALSGDEIKYDQKVNGDLFIAGSNIGFSELIEDNLFMAGKELTLDGKVKGNAFVAGQQIIINEEVKGNLFAGTQSLQVMKDIGGDAFVGAQRVIINGDIDGDLRVGAQEIYINSEKIDGNLEISAEVIKINPAIRIKGKVFIDEKEIATSELEKYFDKEIPNDLKLLAPVKNVAFDIAPVVTSTVVPFAKGMSLVVSILLVIGDILAIVFLFKFMPVKSSQIVDALRFEKKEWLKSILFGLGAYVFMFVGVVLLFVSVIGIPILKILAVFAILVMVISKYYGFYKIGHIVVSKVQPNVSNLWVNAVVGLLVFLTVAGILSVIPVIGGLLTILLVIVFYLWTVGSIVKLKVQNLRKK